MKYYSSGIWGNTHYESPAMPVYTYSEPIRLIPHKCPVCEGVGTVPCNFYTGATLVANHTDPEQCRSCKGQGIIWG